jgi:hypothetical protein
LCWVLLLEEYGVTFEYLPGKKNVAVVADALSRLGIDSLKIQENEEEVLTILSGSESNSIKIHIIICIKINIIICIKINNIQ